MVVIVMIVSDGVLSYLGDQDVLRLDVPVETVVEVTEVDGLQGLPDDALHNTPCSNVSQQSLASQPAADLRLAANWQPVSKSII